VFSHSNDLRFVQIPAESENRNPGVLPAAILAGMMAEL
jgi:hypothetical protein